MNQGIITPKGSHKAIAIIWLGRSEYGRQIIGVTSKWYAVLVFVCRSAIACIGGC
jgi:hypothetical protein